MTTSTVAVGRVSLRGGIQHTHTHTHTLPGPAPALPPAALRWMVVCARESMGRSTVGRAMTSMCCAVRRSTRLLLSLARTCCMHLLQVAAIAARAGPAYRWVPQLGPSSPSPSLLQQQQQKQQHRVATAGAAADDKSLAADPLGPRVLRLVVSPLLKAATEDHERQVTTTLCSCWVGRFAWPSNAAPARELLLPCVCVCVYRPAGR